MQTTPKPKNWNNKGLIQIVILLGLIFLCYGASLQSYCTSNHLVVKGAGLTARQGAKLREYVDDYFKRYHPNQVTGFAPIAYGRSTACLEVYIGPDLQLKGTPASNLEGDYNEIWSMWYLLGDWHKLRAKRIDR
jgi:hypothetical protein